jgi:hypothetical protein
LEGALFRAALLARGVSGRRIVQPRPNCAGVGHGGIWRCIVVVFGMRFFESDGTMRSSSSSGYVGMLERDHRDVSLRFIEERTCGVEWSGLVSGQRRGLITNVGSATSSSDLLTARPQFNASVIFCFDFAHVNHNARCASPETGNSGTLYATSPCRQSTPRQ